jgi:hypothetical protein
MAVFLPSNGIREYIELLIDEASESLTLITSYLGPFEGLFEKIHACGSRGVPIVMVLRHDPDNDRFKSPVLPDLLTTPNLTLFYHGDLHAKIYFNEQNAIVTSQNLTWYERRSWEVGIALDRDVDDTAFIDMTKEASQLIRYSVPIYQNPVAANHVQLLSVWKERLAVIAQTDEDLPSITENDIALRQTFARQARKFSTAEEVLMQEMKQSGVPVNTMATIIQRTPSWVYWTRNRIAS